MVAVFDHFVIFAGMRTGSNFLEESLNEYSGLQCHGELFNPQFLGGPKKTEKFGLSMQDREADPLQLIEKLKGFTDGLHGFRFFHDHDTRALNACLMNRKCAKIILTRNPVESYVSREIARITQQWRLGDLKNVKTAKVTFVADEFSEHLDHHREFQRLLLSGLQKSGQTAFYLDYEDLRDVEAINGLARFLGAKSARKTTATKTKKQNPAALKDKVKNFSEMQKALAFADYFLLDSLPSFEPRRGPSIPKYVAAPVTPLMFLPMASGPRDSILKWMAGLDKVLVDELETGFSQKSLRHWKRKTGNHRTFTVLRHPVLRLHEAFVKHILLSGPECFVAIRNTLRSTYGLPIPKGDPDDNYDADAHRKAFVSFAGFIGGNLNGQTGIRVDPGWATQSETLRGFSHFMVPDQVLREDDLPDDLGDLAKRFAAKSPVYEPDQSQGPYGLEDIYDADVERAVKSAYQRDYMMFGFGPWKS